MRKGFKNFTAKYGKYLFTVAFGVLLYELLEHVSSVGSFFCAFKKAAAPVAYGLAAAYVLFIPVRFLETRILKRLYIKNRRAARVLAMLITYIAAAGAFALILTLVVPRLVSAAAALAESLEEPLSGAGGFADGLIGMLGGSGALAGAIEKAWDAALEKLRQFLPELLPRVISLCVGAMSAAYTLLLSFVISVYAVFRKERLLDQAKRLLFVILPQNINGRFVSACSRANLVFRSFITGQAASCLFVGSLCYMGMRILSLPYPELISAFIFLGALIPVVGPWISTVPSALIILMSSGADKALWFVLLILVIQLFDDYVIYPRVVGGAVGLSSIWVLAAVLIGGGLWGLPGLFLAVPVTAVLYRVVGDAVNRRAAQADN